MANNPMWPAYIAVLTGLVAMLTGIAGAIVSIISYRRTMRAPLGN